MSEAAIRTALYTAVGTVTNVGKVYDYERWAAEWPKFLDLFKTTIGGVNQIRGWEVCYRGSPAFRDPQFGKFTLLEHRFQLQGYMGLSDADETEKTFAVLTQLVRAAADANATIHTSPYRDATPASLVQFMPRMFGSVLCHFAQIDITVTEAVA